MSWLLQIGITNAFCAAVLALVAVFATRLCPRRPALVHCLWLLVLVKLVTPPLFSLSLPWLPPDTPTAVASEVTPPPLVAQVAPGVVVAPAEEFAPPAPVAPPRMFKIEDALKGEIPLPAAPVVEATPTPRDAEGPAPVQRVALVASRPAPPAKPWSAEDVVPILAGVWLLGSLAWFGWAGWHVIQFQRLLRHARPAPAGLQEEADRLARALGLKQAPPVFLLPGPLSPLVWATFGRTHLFFPARLLDRLGEEQRASLLLHELAHVARGDHRVRWLELIATGLYWWYPLVWFARRQIEVHEEECCDAWVVGEMPPRVYAGAILETVDFLSETRPALPVLASGLSRLEVLKQRLSRIMQATTPKRLSWLGWAAVLLLAAVLLPFRPTLAQAPAKPAEAPAAREAKAEVAIEEPDDEPLTFDTRAANLVGGPNDVFTVAWSPDGKRFAVGSGRWDRPGELRVYDAAAGYKRLLTFFEERGVASVAWSPDGKLLATGGYDGQTKLRDGATGRVLLAIQQGSVNRAAFSPDGKVLATATEGRVAKLWEVPSGRELAKLEPEGEPLRFLNAVFSNDGKLVAAPAGDWKPGTAAVAIWDVATRKPKLTLKGHEQAVIGIAFSPDDKVIATGGADNTARLWDAATGKEKALLQGHTSWVETVAFSPDGKILATSSQDGTAKLWDADGKEIGVLEGVPLPARGLAFSPDGKTIAVGGGQKAVKLFDVATRKETQTVQQSDDRPDAAGAILGMAVAPDGKTVAVASESGLVHVRELPSGDLRHVLQGHEDAATCVAWSPDGKTLVTASPDKTIRLWDPEQGKELTSLSGHTSWIYAIAYSSDGKRLASAGYDKTVRVWDAVEGKEIAVLKGHKASVRAVAFSRDGKTLASGGGDKTVKLWDVATQTEKASFKEHQGTVRALAFGPDGRSLAAGGEDGNVFIWDLETGKVRTTLGEAKLTQGGAMPAEVWALAYTPQGQTLVTAASNGMVRIWDPVTAQNRGTLNGHGGQGVTGVSFGPGARFLVSGGHDRTIKLWTSSPAPVQAQATLRPFSSEVWFAKFSPVAPILATGGKDKIVRLWRLPAGFPAPAFQSRTSHVTGVAFTPDGKTVATSNADRTVKLWDPATRRLRLTLEGNQQPVRGVAFSPDGKLLASGSGDYNRPGTEGEVVLFEAASGKLLKRLGTHPDLVFQVAFSRDGKTLASASRDKTAKLWDVEKGEERATLKGHTGVVRSVAFSPDGTTLATGSWDHTVRLWDVETGAESAVLTTGLKAVSGLAWAPDGKAMAVSGLVQKETEPGVIEIWDTAGRKRRTTLQGRYSGDAVAMAFSPDGKTLVTGGGRWGSIGELNFYDPAAGVHLTTVHFAGAMVESVAFSKDGKRLACGTGLAGGPGELRVWDVTPGAMMREIGGHGGLVTCGNFSPDGRLLVTGSWNKTIRVWDVESGKEIKELDGHDGVVRAVAFSPDGKWLASSGEDKTARIWDWEAGAVKHKMTQELPVNRLAWSPDGKTLATGAGTYLNDPGGQVRVWDTATGAEKASLEGHTKHITSLDFAPDGKMLATGCADGSLRVWSVPEFRLLKRIANRGSAQGMTFSSDGKTLATGLYIPDNSAPSVTSVRLWDTTTWAERAALNGHTKFLWTVSFSPGNRTLASASMDGTVKLWAIPRVR